MTDDLSEIERIANGLLRQVAPSQRRSMMRRMGNAIAQSNRQRIAANREPDGEPMEPRKEKPAAERKGKGKKKRLRAKAMFRKLRGAVGTKVTQNEINVGFSGVAARVARPHHFGLRDRPSIKQEPVPYPRRELIGASAEDRDKLLDFLYTHLSAF